MDNNMESGKDQEPRVWKGMFGVLNPRIKALKCTLQVSGKSRTDKAKCFLFIHHRLLIRRPRSDPSDVTVPLSP